MEFGIQIEDNPIDSNFMRFVGWKESNYCVQKYFSKDTVRLISYKLTELLQGVDPQGRPIIVPDKTIASVMDSIYNNYRPATSDIYGRYNVPTDEPQNYVQSMIDQTIEVIFADVRNNLGMDECNSKLSIWTTLYGNFNTNKLRQHAPIKIQESGPNFRGMVSFMNY